MANEQEEIAIPLFTFYAYGYRGRRMFAVRAPFAMAGSGQGLVGRVAVIKGRRYRALRVLRQLDGPIALGEPIGLEVTPFD